MPTAAAMSDGCAQIAAATAELDLTAADRGAPAAAAVATDIPDAPDIDESNITETYKKLLEEVGGWTLEGRAWA
jgi:hypothetical protein